MNCQLKRAALSLNRDRQTQVFPTTIARDDGPLFGKVSGMFWWQPANLRLTAAAGRASMAGHATVSNRFHSRKLRARPLSILSQVLGASWRAALGDGDRGTHGNLVV